MDFAQCEKQVKSINISGKLTNSEYLATHKSRVFFTIHHKIISFICNHNIILIIL